MSDNISFSLSIINEKIFLIEFEFIFKMQFVFFILPWFNYDGRQAVLFDIADRHFYLFGLVLLPGDLIFFKDGSNIL